MAQPLSRYTPRGRRPDSESAAPGGGGVCVGVGIRPSILYTCAKDFRKRQAKVTDSDTVYLGVSAAAAAVGERPAKINKLIYGGWLSTRRGESGPRGGRPAHLISRADLLSAIRRYDVWEREKPRPTPPPPPAPGGRPRQASPRQRRKMARRIYNEKRKFIRNFLNAGARPVKFRGKLKQR